MFVSTAPHGQGDAPLQPRTPHRQRAHRPPGGVVVGRWHDGPVTHPPGDAPDLADLLEAADQALLLLERHRAALELVAGELRAQETLEGEALEALLAQTRVSLANGHGTRPRARRAARV